MSSEIELFDPDETEVPATLDEAFARFLQVDVANGDATPDTIKAYRREVGYWTRWCRERGIAPERARRQHVERYREDLKARGTNVTTRSHKLSIIRRFYDAAVRWGFTSKNPASAVRGGRDFTPEEEKVKALTRNALDKLVRSIPTDTLSGKRDRCVVALMAVHGLRRVEVHRLDHESLMTDGETPALRVTGKGMKTRTVYLRQDTYDALLAYLQAKLDGDLPLSGPLFVAHGNRSRGHRISRRALNWIVDRYLDETHLKKAGVSCHALRHTHGTLAVQKGAAIEHLRDEMGHARLETTGIYVKAVARRANNPALFIDVEI